MSAQSQGQALPERPLRLVHTSDVHIGSETFRRQDGQRPSTERAFERVIDLVVEQAPDLFLIAGDLFDHNRVLPEEVEFAHDQMARVACPTVLIPGNHDCMDDGSVYRAFDFKEVGPHVYPLMSLEGETLEFPDLQVTVWGRGMVDHDPSYQPLAGVPQRRPRYWHVGLAHGYYVEDDWELRSSLIRPDEIATSGLDYLALGHVHVFRDVSHGTTRAFYPGTPGPLHAGAAEKGSVALVELHPERGVDVRQHMIFL